MLQLALFLGLVTTTFASAGTVYDRLYDNASNGSPAIALIQGAKKTIDIEIYQMQDLQVLSAVKAAVDRHVRVRVVQDASTSLTTCHLFDPVVATDSSACVVQKQMIPYIRNHGGQYVAFNVDLCGVPGKHCFQHGKMIITDSNRAMLSTGNLNASSLCDKAENPSNCNRDYSIVTVDPQVVSTLQYIFEKDVANIDFDLEGLLKTPAARRITVSPLSSQPLVDFINSATKTIQIQNQYLKEPDVNAALMNAAKRGVKVFVMVESICAYGKPKLPDDRSAIATWTNTFTAFDQVGIFTKIFNGSMQINGILGYLHAKVILVDGARAWVGSVNGSDMSINMNREYGLFTNEAQPVALLSKLLYQDYMDKNAESWKDSLICKKDHVRPPTSEKEE